MWRTQGNGSCRSREVSDEPCPLSLMKGLCRAGEPFNVVFQKNLDRFNSASPVRIKLHDTLMGF